MPWPARLKSGFDSETGRAPTCLRREIARKARFRFGIVLALVALIVGFAFKGLTQEAPTEYQLKAAFLFNFAKFVEWPATAFPDANSPIVIGVLGKNVFGNDLEKVIRDKTVNNRHFQFKYFDPGNQVTNCHILFISPAIKDDLPKIVADLHNASVLTVSETDQFIAAGGMINFIIGENKTVRFQISDDAAKKAGLKISSKLLSLAAHGH